MRPIERPQRQLLVNHEKGVDAMPGTGDRSWRQRRVAVGLSAAIMLSPAIGIGGWAVGIQLVGNIHAVESGAFYRSAQLNGEDLAEVIRDYKIRTVLNLRGPNDAQPWYDDEIKATAAAGATHVDIRMSAREEPDDALLAALIKTLRTAPKPILVHCYSGSDRTGLASALYELVVEGKPAAEAAGQLSFFYGHFPWLGSRTVAMDNTFKRVAAGERP